MLISKQFLMFKLPEAKRYLKFDCSVEEISFLIYVLGVRLVLRGVG